MFGAYSALMDSEVDLGVRPSVNQRTSVLHGSVGQVAWDEAV